MLEEDYFSEEHIQIPPNPEHPTFLLEKKNLIVHNNKFNYAFVFLCI